MQKRNPYPSHYVHQIVRCSIESRCSPCRTGVSGSTQPSVKVNKCQSMIAIAWPQGTR
ncbi:hypothetical protein JB92DRAFT_3033328 [Gautieria morchelliformis]|nr:hypothetical protein JB92DRAFT_3033328 [Gautieria morchelliformis]